MKGWQVIFLCVAVAGIFYGLGYNHGGDWFRMEVHEIEVPCRDE